MATTDIETTIKLRGFQTVQEHDDAVEKLIASGKAVVEPELKPKQFRFCTIGCPKCAWRMNDTSATKEEDGKKYRNCACFRCGNKLWRRIP